MKLLFLLLVSLPVFSQDIVTIDSSKYSFNVTQETVNIMQPEQVKETSLAKCIREREQYSNYEEALDECVNDRGDV